jgi:hypothetical protein
MKNEIEPRTWTDSLDKLPKLWIMDVRFELWSVRILPVALGPGVYSASNRNEYQKH